VLLKSRDMCFMKRIESLLKIASIKFKVLKVRNPFSQTSGFVPRRQNH